MSELVHNSQRYGTSSSNFAYDKDYIYSGTHRNLISKINTLYPDIYIGENLYQTNEIKRVKETLVDKDGNVYISDPNSHSVWKVIPNKELIRLGGNGQPGFKDGKGTDAQFHFPTAMSLDGQGNLFVADTLNNAIRKITPDGTVSTFYAEK